MKKLLLRGLIIYLAVMGGICTRDYLYLQYIKHYGVPIGLMSLHADQLGDYEFKRNRNR